jgi:hypothetical protein
VDAGGIILLACRVFLFSLQNDDPFLNKQDRPAERFPGMSEAHYNSRAGGNPVAN